MIEEVQYITPEKKNDLERELQELIAVKRTEILKRLSYAKSLGDLSENAEYHSAREDQAKNEARIGQVEHILKYAEIVQHSSSDYVCLGCSVVVQKTGASDKKTFTIVGEEEADMTIGKLSHKSPLGNALLNKKKGEEATLTTPKGDVVYKVIKIS